MNSFAIRLTHLGKWYATLKTVVIGLPSALAVLLCNADFRSWVSQHYPDLATWGHQQQGLRVILIGLGAGWSLVLTFLFVILEWIGEDKNRPDAKEYSILSETIENIVGRKKERFAEAFHRFAEAAKKSGHGPQVQQYS